MTTESKPVVKLVKKRAHQIYKTKDGKRVPGSSTIAKIGDSAEGLIYWAWDLGMQKIDFRKVKDEAADAGTVGHFMIECFLKGNEPDVSDFSATSIDLATNIFVKFHDYWEQEGMTFVASELELVSDIHGYGGTIDIIARDRDGRLCIIDEKSSKAIYESHFYQLASYENLWNEHNEEKIARRAIFRNGKKEKGDTELRWIPSLDPYFQTFLAQLALYQAKKKTQF